MDAAQITAIAVSLLGAGGGLTVIINNLINKGNGKTEQRRLRNADMKTQRDEAWARAEKADARAEAVAAKAEERIEAANRKRRILQEYASQLRSAYYEAGRTPAAWPEIEDTLTPEEVRELRSKE
jgi:hypothetical protein